MSNNDVLSIFSREFDQPPVITEQMLADLRANINVNDSDFDKIFPHYYQLQSAVHWSSIQVAAQIADWIKPLKRKKFIDIGCGVGKLCILLRLLTDHEIYGIEQRRNLVKIANEIIERNNLQNLFVTEENMLDLNWADYDIYYLYNPFQEHVVGEGIGVLEGNVDFDKKHFVHYTSEVFRQLAWAAPGKCLITFHGYGGSVPRSWKMTKSRHIENGDLTMWIKEGT